MVERKRISTPKPEPKAKTYHNQQNYAKRQREKGNVRVTVWVADDKVTELKKAAKKLRNR